MGDLLSPNAVKNWHDLKGEDKQHQEEEEVDDQRRLRTYRKLMERVGITKKHARYVPLFEKARKLGVGEASGVKATSDVGEESGLLVQDTDRKKAQEVIQAAGHTVQRSATAISRPTYATNRGISHKNTCHDGSRGRHSSLLFWSDRVSSNP